MSQQYDISNPDTWQSLGSVPPEQSELSEQSGQRGQAQSTLLNVADPETWEALPQSPAQAGLRLNFRAGKLTPEQAQEAYAMTQKTQLPQSAVLNNRDRVREMLEEQELDAFAGEAPLTAGWMAADILRTNMARDDAETLKKVEAALQGTVKGAWLAGEESGRRNMELFGLLERRNTEGESPELNEAIRRVKAARQKAASFETSGVGQFVAQATAEQLPIMAYTLGEQARGLLYGASVGAVAGAALGGVGAVPGAVAGGVTALSSAVLGAKVFGAGFTGMAVYNLESVLAEEDYRDAGLAPDVARVAAKVYGGLASIIEMPETLLGMNVLFGTAGEAVQGTAKETVKATVKGALADFVKHSVKLQTAEALEEGAQELTQWAVGEVAKLATGVESREDFAGALNNAAHAALKAFAVPFSATHTVPRFALDVRSAVTDGGPAFARDAARAAMQADEQAFLAGLDELSAQSKLAQRDPLLYEEAVRAMNQGGSVQHVYIPAGGLAAALDGMDAVMTPGSESAARLQAVLGSLGVSGEDMALALAGGTDLVIPVETYAAAVAKDRELAALVAQDRRLTPDGFTVREMEQWARDNQTALREAVEASRSEDERASSLEAETRDIHWAVQQQLETTGQPRNVAAANATQVAAVFGTLARRSGLSPMQLWDRYGADVAQEGGFTVEAGEVLPVGAQPDSANLADSATSAGRAKPVPVPPVYTSPGVAGQSTDAQPRPSSSRAPRHAGVFSLNDVYTKAAESREPFRQSVTAMAEATGGRALFRHGDGLKSRERAQQKLDRDYDGKDVDRVVDVLGGTLLYDGVSGVRTAMTEIQRMVGESGGEIVRVKDRFASPSGGYKDVLINVRMPNGFVTELLVTTEAMAEAKNGLGHKLYEAQQLVDEMIVSGGLEGDAQKAVKDMLRCIKDASIDFYGSTGHQSNETASSSVITYPLWKTSALLPFLSSSSLYPKLAELLGNIRYSVPSSASANGMSSYSINRLTNMGSLGVPFSHGMPLASLPSKNKTLDAIDVPPVSEESITQNEATGNAVRGVLPGSAISISLADGTELAGRFEVRDAAAIVPSHDALRHFQKNEAYPADTQERPYHSSVDEQQKVRHNAANLDTRYVISDNPDAVNGPPIVTEGGLVLGGNSRAMSVQLAYAEHPEGAQTYKAVLRERAKAFGLDAAAIDAMQAPMLVRVAEERFDSRQQARLVRLMNQNRTQGLNANAEAVSRGRLVSPSTLATLAAAMQDHDTLLAYLATPGSRTLVDALAADGVLESTQRSRMTNRETGLLNDEGKRFVQLVLRGRALPDYDLIDAAPLSVLQSLDRILPHVATMQAVGGAWDITPTLTAAVRQIIRWKATGYRQISTYFNQGSMVPDHERDNPGVRTLATLLAGARPTRVGEDFARYASMARQGGSGMAALPGVEMPTPESAFQKAFGKERSLSQSSLNERAEQNLREDVAAWEQRVDALIRGTLNLRENMTMLRQTPLVLQLLEAQNLPVQIGPGKMLRAMREHGLLPELIKQVPAAMADPVMVFASAAHGGDLLLMLDLKDAAGATVNVPVALELKGTEGYVVNLATTVFGRQRGNTGKPDNQWFANQIGMGNLLYRNNKKSRDWARTSGLQLPGANTRTNSANKRLYTDADLVNLRSLRPDQYQGTEEAPRGRITLSTSSGRPLITLFQKADASTFLHESGHAYLEMLRSLGTTANVAPDIAALWQQAQATLERITGQPLLDGAGNIGTAAHEAWATSLEGYFMKGEAPSMELREVFARFSAWLRALYNAWRSMAVTPSAELAPVFDRLFATDAQMAEVEAWHDAHRNWASLLGQEAGRLQAAQEKAGEDARTRRLATLSRAYVQALGGKKRLVDEARATVNAMPVQAAMDEAATGAGLDRDTVCALLGEERGRALGKKRPGLLRVKGGDDPMMLAARHGFGSTQQMLAAMLDAESKSALVSRLVSRQEQALRDKIARGEAENEAMPGDADYHSDAQLAVLLAQRQLLASRQLLGAGQERHKAASLEASALREAARATVAAMPVREAMQAHRHSLAERRAAKQAWEAAKSGDWEAATLFKRQEAVSHAMYLAATEAREKVQRGVERVKAAVGFKRLSADARDIMLDTAYRYGLMPYGGKSLAEGYAAWLRDAARDGRTYPTLGQWAANAAELGYPVAIADSLLTDNAPENYRDRPLTAFAEVLSAIEQVRKVDRLENTAMVNGRRVELAALCDLLEQAAATAKTPDVRSRYRRDKGKELLGGIHAMHAKMEHILLDLDGWRHGGIWWKTFFAPIADAENARSDSLRDISTQLRARVRAIMPSRLDRYRFFNDRLYIEAIRDSLTMNQIVAVALNMGNAANRQRLLDGEGWTQAQLDAVLAPMEQHHWDFVQGVWDDIETLREPAFALQRDMAGASPEAVQAVPVQTPFGEYRGGYYPIVYDARRGSQAHARHQKELDKQLFGGRNYGSAMTRHGHLKERGSRGTGEPLNLDVGVMAEHLYNTVHDLTHRKAVVELAKLMRHKPVMELAERYAGKEIAREFLPWLQSVAGDMLNKEGVTQIHRWARWARRGTAMMQMGLKITTMVQQPLGIFQTVAVLGVKDTMNGVWEVYHRPDKVMERARWVMEQSSFMRNRMAGFDREIHDAMKNLALAGQLSAEAERFAYMGMGLAQLGVDIPTWTGAYRKAQAEGRSDPEAVAYADSLVRLTQSSGMTKDLARVQRGSDLMRLFTMFYSYFNALYNLAWRQKALTRSWKDIPAAAASALLLWFMPAVLSELVSGRGPDDDDGEEWAPWMVQKIALYPLQMLVGVRDVANFTAEAKYGYQLSPAASAGKALGAWPRSVMKALEEEDPAKLLKPTVEGLGYLFVLPLRQPMITVGNLYDYATGETPDFQLRDLFFTKQESRR